MRSALLEDRELPKVSHIVLGLGLALLVASSAIAASPLRSLLQENRLDEAVAICRQFEVLSTNDNDNFLACAWVYYRTDRLDSAERIMDKLKRSFALPEYQLLSAYGRMKRKQYDEARRILSSVGTDHKGTAIGLTAQELSAELYELQGNLDTAGFIYKGVVNDDPKRARAHWGLGRYYLARGETRRAVTHLEATARLWPKHRGSRFNLGVLYLAQDNLGEAARWLGESYKLDKADAGVLEQMGVLFEKKGLLTEAVRYWQRALEIKKDSPLAKEKVAIHFVAVIDNLIEQRKFVQALQQLDTYKGNLSDNPKLLMRRGMLYRNIGRFDKGAADLKAYLNANPNDPAAARELGICYVNLKIIDQAGNYFRKAVSLEPGNGFNHGWLAFVYEAKGDLFAAREEWRRAVEAFRDPRELEKATRKLASIEKKIGKSGKSKPTKKKNRIEVDPVSGEEE